MKRFLLSIISVCVAFMMCAVCLAAPAAVADDDASLMSENILGASPESYVTYSDLLTASARLHSMLYGGNIEKKYDEGTYITYALNNGIFTEDKLSDLSAPVTRGDAVLALFNAAKDAVDLSEISPLYDDCIPDASVTADYYEAAHLFIEAGIVKANDEYGSFKPGSNVTRYELSDIVDRLLGVDERFAQVYIKYAGDAPFYLIDDFIMEVPVVGINNIASGWKHDYTGSVDKGISGAFGSKVTDLNTDDNITISRTIEPQSDGILQLETSFTINYGFQGLRFQFLDSEGNIVYEAGTVSTSSFFNGKTSNSRYISKQNRTISLPAGDVDGWNFNGRTMMRIVLDLDEGKADLYVAGTKVGVTYSLGTVKDVAEFRITTGISERIELNVHQVHLYKNWYVNDLMRATMPGKTPLGYTTSGNVTVEKTRSQADNLGDHWSAKIVASAQKKSYAKRSFKAISGSVVMEAYMLLPTGDDGAYFAVTSGGTPVIKVETKNNKFMCADTELMSFSDNIWQLIRIEADTVTQKAKIKIRGKYATDENGNVIEVPFLAKTKYFDGLEIGITPDSDAVMWFDDVEAYKTFEYDDYVPEPVPVENDYYVGMSICNLWRNGSHYGWSFIQPHHEPVTGFYDEGIPEAMDWEIKMLAEHGFDFYNFCWYSPQGVPNEPIKKSRMNDAIHDGYFNAKYSDKLKISLMFENASMRTAGTLDEFKENIWSYWKEWYFTDPRYFTIQEDGKTYTYLTIYQYQYFLQMCNDRQILSDTGAMLYKNAQLATEIANAAEVLKWMSDDLVASGISDGLIVGFNNNLQNEEDAKNIAAISAKIGLDYVGVFPYSWGTTAYNLDTQKAFIERGYQNGVNNNLSLLALPCIGFNRIGWYHEEKFPLIANKDLETLLEYFRDDYMKRFASNGGSWKQKYIQFATWNEFGEGHYFYPSDDNGGYDYLNTMAEVLSGDTTGVANDTIPTQAQKDRIGHLYVGDSMPIRRKYDIVESEPETVVEVLKYTFNPGTAVSTKGKSMFDGWTTSGTTEAFENIGSCTNWGHIFGHGDGSGCNNKYYNGVLTTYINDPMMYRTLPTPLKAEDADVAYITMEFSKPHTTAQMFFVSDHPDLKDFDVDSNTGKRRYTAGYVYSFDVLSTEKVTYVIDLSSNAGWKGNITDLRFDFGSLVDNVVKFYGVTFAKYDDAARQPEIEVDGVAYKTADYGEIRGFDRNEIYIAPAESEHLYKLLHIAYHWPPERDSLVLDLPNGKLVEFTVGSKSVLVDGKEYTLDKAVEVYDGVPVIPLMWLLELGEYKYVYDFTARKLEVTVADKVVFHEIANADAEGSDTGAFYTQNSNTGMTIVKDPFNEENKVWQHNSSDPVGGVAQYNYVRCDFNFLPNTTYIIDFDARVCPELSDGSSISSVNMYLNPRYADTALGSGYDHPSSSALLTPEWKHFRMEYTTAATLDESSSFEQQISFYIDPYGDKSLGVDFQMDNLTVRTEPLAFIIRNGDAEGDETDVWYSANANITIETEADGNRYWHVEYDGESSSAWTYMRQHTTFEPGVTYYYSVDVRLGTGHDGSTATTNIDINARYKDLVRENQTNIDDHNQSVGEANTKFTTSDTWTTCKGSFTISMGYTPGGVNSGYDEITFFTSPVSNNKVGVAYDIDNFVVSTKFEDIYG